jgi:hypothetical protein
MRLIGITVNPTYCFVERIACIKAATGRLSGIHRKSAFVYLVCYNSHKKRQYPFTAFALKRFITKKICTARSKKSNKIVLTTNLNKFDVRKSVHHHTTQINKPTRCNSFTSLLLDVYVWFSMFRAIPRPSSGAYNCISNLWFYCWSVEVKPEAANAVVSS